MKWLLLILSLPTHNATARMRAWRTLKAAGAAVLRDGVYLLPDTREHQELFDGIAQDVHSSDGSTYVFSTAIDDGSHLIPLFDRQDDYGGVLSELVQVQQQLAEAPLQEATRQLRKLRKSFAAIVAIDFFPGEPQAQTQMVLRDFEAQLNRQLSPNEPLAVTGHIQRLGISQYQGRLWATRKRPWIDRLACAWLISRFIDAEAHFLWLDSPADCPDDALGFDFDGARFSHINGKVTFEVLLASFSLDHPGLQRMGALVHYLDVGGVQPGEASGLEQILWGLRNTISDDDQLVKMSNGLFDALLTAFTEKDNHESN